MTYLNGDQLHVLSNAYSKPGYVNGSSLFSRKGVTVDTVENLFLEGYLSKKGRTYSSNRRTETALTDHGFDVAAIETADKPKPVAKIDPEDRLLSHVEGSEDIIRSRAEVQAMLMENAIQEAKAGNPWNFIRRQWPELVIRDEVDLEYFKRHCERTHSLDLRLDDTQVELIENAFNPTIREIAIKGSTSPGKGFATALLMNIWYHIYEDRITIVSQSSRHAKDVMFAEFVTWRKKMRYPDKCETQVAGVVDHNNPKHFVNIANPEAGEGLSGGHGPNILFVFDEASSVASDLPINARKQARLIVFISNPRVLAGIFYDLYPKVEPDKNQVWLDKGIKRACLTFGGTGALNVRAKRVHIPYGPPGGLEGETLDGQKFFIAEGDKIPDEFIPHTRALIPGQMDWQKYYTIMQSPNEIERAWSGEGKFPPEDADFQIIAPSWLKVPCDLWNLHKDKIEVTALGLDLAASVDGDCTVLVAGGPLGIKTIFRTQKAQPMDTLSWIVSCCKSIGVELTKGEVPIAVDAIGAGGNVMAAVMEQAGAIVYPIKGNMKADNPNLYCNRRAELYGVLGVRLDPASSYLEPFMIPDDTNLKEELAAHEKHFVADMTRFYATPKVPSRGQFANVQCIKDRIGRSPDTADAVVLCYWAVRDTEFDGSVIDQFNPAEALEAYREQEDGNIINSRGDGGVYTDSPDDFSSMWGQHPSTIEDEVEAFRKAINGMKPGSSMFGGFG
jgi:hypothetical protein